MPAASCHVALLRGINVGGKRRLPMADLAAMLSEAGCADVRTYIQSGNAVFTATPACAKRLPDVVSKRIAREFGFEPTVLLRSADEVREVAASNPFLKPRNAPGLSEAQLHVGFLADVPDVRRLRLLDRQRSPGDSFSVRGREIYVCLTNGMARTRLTYAYFESTLGTVATFRNWRTVLKLLDMVQRPGGGGSQS
jgi:uncharacterized protein (DUF1697 family)